MVGLEKAIIALKIEDFKDFIKYMELINNNIKNDKYDNSILSDITNIIFTALYIPKNFYKNFTEDELTHYKIIINKLLDNYRTISNKFFINIDDIIAMKKEEIQYKEIYYTSLTKDELIAKLKAISKKN